MKWDAEAITLRCGHVVRPAVVKQRTSDRTYWCAKCLRMRPWKFDVLHPDVMRAAKLKKTRAQAAEAIDQETP